jgi:hypothetical protein
MKTLLFLVVLTTSTLVLRSGDRIVVDGDVTQTDEVVTFKSGGLLYSMPLAEVDLEASKQANAESEAEEPEEETDEQIAGRRLKVSAEERARLLKELEANHEGVPAS